MLERQSYMLKRQNRMLNARTPNYIIFILAQLCVAQARLWPCCRRCFSVGLSQMAYRSKPYGSRGKPVAMDLSTGVASQVHPQKGNITNADVAFYGPRMMGVLDGVSGVTDAGLLPEAMSSDLALRISTELEARLNYNIHKNAQEHDRDLEFAMKSSVRANWPGSVKFFGKVL